MTSGFQEKSVPNGELDLPRTVGVNTQRLCWESTTLLYGVLPATPLLRDDHTKPDGSRYEMVAWSVPESDAFPEGIKYCFQYMDADGDTLLRFDNAPHHTDVGHHRRHTPTGDVEQRRWTAGDGRRRRRSVARPLFTERG